MGTSNKNKAIEFLKLASSGKVREAYDKFISSAFRHHNAYFSGDAEALAKGMEDSVKQFPHKTLEVLRALEDGNLVAVHLRVKLTPSGQDVALIHIFRFEGGRIVELWEAAQEIPKEIPNKNGVF